MVFACQIVCVNAVSFVIFHFKVRALSTLVEQNICLAVLQPVARAQLCRIEVIVSLVVKLAPISTAMILHKADIMPTVA